jgi:hypothetical protein
MKSYTIIIIMFVKIFAPTVLTTVVVIGVTNMQSVTKDIKTQCGYGMRYNPEVYKRTIH